MKGFGEVRERVNAVVRGQVEAAFAGEVAYSSSKAEELAAAIPAKCVEELEGVATDIKFCVNCTILPKGDGFGLHSSTSCLWDEARDGLSTVQWENDQYFCLVLIIGAAAA